DDGVAQVNAAADAEGCGKRLQRLDDRHRRIGPAIKRQRASLVELEFVALGRARLREGIARQYPGVIRNAAGGGQDLLAADGDAPQSAVDRVLRARRRQRQAARAEVVELVLTF